MEKKKLKNTEVFFAGQKRDLSKLPKWAQDYISILKQDCSNFKMQWEQVASSLGPKSSPITFSPQSEPFAYYPLPEGATIGFQLADEKEIQVSIEKSQFGTPILSIRSLFTPIYIKSEAVNSIGLYLELERKPNNE